MLAASCKRDARRRHEGAQRRPSARPRRAQDGHGAAGRRPAARARLRTIRISSFWHWADRIERHRKPLPGGGNVGRAMPAIRRCAVNLDACIQCNLCVRACREVQVNDVIGMAYRNARREDRVRLRRSDGPVHLRRLRRMRAGLPDRRADAGGLSRCSMKRASPYAPIARWTACARIAASAARSPIRSRTSKIIYAEGAMARRTITGFASRAGSASTTSIIRID